MGLLRNREERRQARADRKRRRANRKRDRADRLDATASSLDSTRSEEATIIATDQQGRQVKQDVLLRKEASAKRNMKLMQLESRLDQLEDVNASLMEEIDALETELDDVMNIMERKDKGGQLLSKGFLGAANALLTFININDGIQNRGALLASEAMDALVDFDQLDRQQQDWARLARVLLKAVAYFDPKAGLMSILESEKKP
jgi:chromosome segregation ATPase